MTNLAPTAAPAHAIRVWADGLSLFAEIPGNPPYIMRLALTEAGLHKALSLLRSRHAEAKTGRFRVPERMISGKSGPKPSEAQRRSALEVLRKMGMV